MPPPKRFGAQEAEQPGRLRSIARTFQKLERLIVAMALKIMRELRINRARQRRLQPVDLFRNGLQAR